MSKIGSIIYGDYFFIIHIQLWQILIAIVFIAVLIYLLKRKRNNLPC
jgi:hypothetical protein